MNSDIFNDTLINVWAYVLFIFVLAGLLSGAMVCLMVGALSVRGVWRWLMHRSYSDLVRATARKVLR